MQTAMSIPRPTYPRPITSIHQIELSSHCNLKCKYCPSPQLETLRDQPAQNMTAKVFARALAWAAYYEYRGTQHELALTGIGEAILHPNFVECLRMARQILPRNPITISTNGLAFTDELAKEIAPFKPEIYVSLHRPEKAGPAIEIAKKYGIYKMANASFATSAFNWAGQLDWFVSAPKNLCGYLAMGWSVVLVDGRITTCCLDASGVGVVGTVDDEPGSLSITPYKLCLTCHEEIP